MLKFSGWPCRTQVSNKKYFLIGFPTRFLISLVVSVFTPSIGTLYFFVLKIWTPKPRIVRKNRAGLKPLYLFWQLRETSKSVCLKNNTQHVNVVWWCSRQNPFWSNCISTLSNTACTGMTHKGFLPSAFCVQRFSNGMILQFIPLIALCCVLHRYGKPSHPSRHVLSSTPHITMNCGYCS